ncbi:MAG: hypothetical protein CMA12_06860 [Euryarchaeota archaeon]|nr:hypothetical protein [Euryarchaeota archaeon]|tara:strand:+ start:326 stop:589 length:264 start_codon:yes stop_codon:yes gene_type:complete
MDKLPISWWADPMVWLGLLQGAGIWFAMVIFLGLPSAWISFACGGLIGFFLYLVALAYEDYRFAKAIFLGVLINAFLSSFSVFIAFF